MAHFSPREETESSLFRSEDMSLVQLYIPSELAHAAVSELGELGLVQFRDLNPEVNAFQRTFVNEIRRLDEMDRKTRFLTAQCQKSKIRIKMDQAQLNVTRARTLQEIDELEDKLNDIEARLSQMNQSQETLNKRFLELTEMRYVLRETALYFDQAESRQDFAVNEDEDMRLLQTSDMETGTSKSVSLSFVAGIIPRNRMGSFERVLWRALRGNLFMNYTEIEEPIMDPNSDEMIQKNVFIVFAHGTEIIAKIKKISESLGATVYPLDPSPQKRSTDMLEVAARIEDLNNVMFNTNATKRAELLKVAESLGVWSILIKKEKAIYHNMNLFNYDQTRKCLIAEGWCPKNSIQAIQYALHAVSERSGSLVPPILNEMKTHMDPPTFHKTNKYTKAFQAIIDSYGMAKYKEVNPGLFTVITFPFLFAVMFGDFGHGSMLLVIALYMIFFEKRLDRPDMGEMFGTLFGGRYILFLMALFSIYVGLLYNDIFSLPVYMAPSAWQFTAHHNGTEVSYDAVKVNDYPFGMDPAWRLATNSLLFLNSYKMKMSIIIGVFHMLFGICLTVYNSKYFNKPLNIYCEFIPQFIFMMSIFGYLVFMIIYKWLVDWQSPPRTPPGLLNTLIFMFLNMGDVVGDQLYAGQPVIQKILLFLALICVPWMLVIKPYILYRQHQRHLEEGYHTVLGDSPGGHSHLSDIPEPNPAEEQPMVQPSAAMDSGEHGEKFEMGEIVVHQVIHTIEFCLGSISNTASYLRLWALSLAHAQLSEVLWEMTIKQTLGGGLIFLGYALWFSLTLFILVSMEGLSAFLHALRLHWVEFNSKFYEGSGYKFMPFSFSNMDEEQE